MPLEHPDFLKTNPYYDDFSDEKNFLRVLFKPGYAVQARELTQLQTILQSQISKFADHIFKEGSKVFGGNVNTAFTTFIRVEKFLQTRSGNSFTANSSSADSYLDTLKINTESLFISNDENASYIGSVEHIQLEIFTPEDNFAEPIGELRLVHFAKSGYSENDDYTILFVDQTSGDALSAENVLKVKGQEIYFKIIPDSIISFSGPATLVSVASGIYYTNGMFVNNERQHFSIYVNSKQREAESTLLNGIEIQTAPANVRLFNFPSVRVGFTLVKTAITVEEDSTLRDPSMGFYNANAPGADRFKINLVLTSLPYDASSVEIDNYANKDFIQLVRIVRGNIDWVRRLPNYSEILDLLARRTYDESGSYTTKPFALDIKNHLRRDTFELIVQNSPIDSLSNQYLQVGSYIWGITEEELSGDFPFNIQDFSDLTFPVGRIISVVPFRENDINLIDPNVVSKKILVQPLNSVRFSFIPGTYQTFNYQKSSVSVKTTVSATYSRFITDSEGFYSVYDNPSGDTNKLLMSLKPGKAYVYGYEQDFYAPINIEYLKGRSEIDRQTQLSTLSAGQILGNYVVGNFIEHDISLNIDDDTIDWEKLPKFELQSEDIFTLIMEKGENVQASGKVHSWSSFNITSFSNAEQRKMYGFSGPNSTTQEFESVILIK